MEKDALSQCKASVTIAFVNNETVSSILLIKYALVTIYYLPTTFAVGQHI